MIYRSESGDISMLMAGETMLSRRLSVFEEREYLAAVELCRKADVAFTNLETAVRHPHEGYPAVTRGTPMTTPPALLEDLKWIGFNLVSTANNHAGDYGTDGILASVQHLRNADLAFAGSGANLAEALAPGYLDTRAGRVALVAVTSLFKPGELAAEQRPDAAGRPGVAPLRFATTYTVDAAAFAALDRISSSLGFAQDAARARSSFYSEAEIPKDDAERVTFLGNSFCRGGEFSQAARVNQADADACLRSIREARRQADWVILSFHNHEYNGHGRLTARSKIDLEQPADFVVEFSRAAIDAGADVVAGHGMHVTLGIEVYRGRPIFYSLGNHILQNDTVTVFPAEAYERFGLGHQATPADFLDARSGNGTRSFPAFREHWEGFAGICNFRGRRLAELRLVPVDLGFGRPRAQLGRPVLATGEVAQRALERVARLSRQYNTEIRMDGETALVQLR